MLEILVLIPRLLIQFDWELWDMIWGKIPLT